MIPSCENPHPGFLRERMPSPHNPSAIPFTLGFPDFRSGKKLSLVKKRKLKLVSLLL